ncbi:hypothetical protein GCM10027088_39490 [Nocardia goodfellowii]
MCGTQAGRDLFALSGPGQNRVMHSKNTIDRADVVGMWVTGDGHIRQELRADGRYDEARGSRRSAYTGRYTVTGNHLDYIDDLGFTATGEIRDGVLYHEHLVLYRQDRAS